MSDHSFQHLLTHASNLLKEQGIDTSQLDARILLEAASGMSREELFLALPQIASAAIYENFQMLLERRVRREPIAQILGYKEFCGLEFFTTRDTLTPRPDSEIIVEVAAKLAKTFAQPSILDLGTGTGCLLLATLAQLPTAAGVGVDVSEAALEVARQNAANLDLEQRANFVNSNWDSKLSHTFDIVISNPPYIPATDQHSLAPEVTDYEPHTALFGGEDGLTCYQQIAACILKLLKPAGSLVLECGQGQEKQIAEIMAMQGLKLAQHYPDLAGITRCLVFTRT